jgi:hypothetical protein
VHVEHVPVAWVHVAVRMMSKGYREPHAAASNPAGSGLSCGEG